MPTTGNHTLDVILYVLAAIVLISLAYRLGRWVGTLSAAARSGLVIEPAAALREE